MHLHTRVGDYRISTVGDYHPLDVLNPDRERRAQPVEKAHPIGAGDAALYETFVFVVAGEGTHGEGEVQDWGEIDSERYATAEDAERGHMEFCRKYARISVVHKRALA